MPYKQGVVGSNPSAPTNIKIKEYNQKLYSFFMPQAHVSVLHSQERSQQAIPLEKIARPTREPILLCSGNRLAIEAR